MANRIVLNETSYHGAGAIKEIPGEIKRRGLKKAFVCSDPDLVKFKVTRSVPDWAITGMLSPITHQNSKKHCLLNFFNRSSLRGGLKSGFFVIVL